MSLFSTGAAAKKKAAAPPRLAAPPVTATTASKSSKASRASLTNYPPQPPELRTQHANLKSVDTETEAPAPSPPRLAKTQAKEKTTLFDSDNDDDDDDAFAGQRKGGKKKASGGRRSVPPTQQRDVARLVGMGLTPEQALAALRDAGNDVELAATKVRKAQSTGLPVERLEEVRSLFQQSVREGRAVPWSRAKLMLVGEGRAGKTATYRSLMGKPFEHTESTVGADTSMTCTAERLDRVVNWTERKVGNELASQAARAVAEELVPSVKSVAPVSTPAPTPTPQPSTNPTPGATPPPQPPVQPVQRAPSLRDRLMGSARRLSPGNGKPIAETETDDAETKTDPQTPDAPPANTTPRPPPPGPAAPIPLPEPEVASLFDESLVADALREAKDGDKASKLTLSIWDFGGQEVFYSLHHAFLTKYGVYLVVFNMAKLVGPDATPEARAEALDMLRFWVRSVQLHARGAPTFLVGTHKDVASDPVTLLELHTLLTDHLALLTLPQIRPMLAPPPLTTTTTTTNGNRTTTDLCFWPVDNVRGVGGDPVLARLREAIVDSVKDADFVNQPVPLAWTRALDVLMGVREQKAHLSLAEAAEIAETCGVQAEHVEPMLAMFHELGVLTFFTQSPALKRVVVLNPQWLISLLAEVVRDYALHWTDVWRDPVLRSERYAADVFDLRTRALASRRLLAHLWRREDASRREFLLALMQAMWLAAPWRDPAALAPTALVAGDDDALGRDPNDKFLVPSLLAVSSTTGVAIPESAEESPEVEFEFSFAPFLPRGLFPRLVAQATQHGYRVFSDSRTPLLTKTRALLSFGWADFCVDYVPQREAIRVGVVDAQYAPLVREVLVSMVEQLRDEVMGVGLDFRVLLLVGKKGKLHGVRLSDAEANRTSPTPKELIRAVDTVAVSAAALDVFFAAADHRAADGTVAVPRSLLLLTPLPALRPGEHHVFVSHYQRYAGDACAALCELFASRGVVPWLDQNNDGEITSDAMLGALERSRTYLLFLCKDVFARPFVLMEARHALKLGRPVVLVHESDVDRDGYSSIGVLKRQAPDDLRALFDAHESEPFQRRRHLRDAMVAVLVERIAVGAVRL